MGVAVLILTAAPERAVELKNDRSVNQPPRTPRIRRTSVFLGAFGVLGGWIQRLLQNAKEAIELHLENLAAHQPRFWRGLA